MHQPKAEMLVSHLPTRNFLRSNAGLGSLLMCSRRSRDFQAGLILQISATAKYAIFEVISS